jgi:hypothetical protein
MILFKALPVLDDLTTSNLSEPGVLVLTDSNVAEDAAHAEWNSATAYIAGDIVKVTSTHRLYEAVTNNTNQFPPDNLSPDITGGEWIEIGPTNRWKAFDQAVQSQTLADSSAGITYTFQINSLITAIALFNLVGSDVLIRVTPPGAGDWDDSTPTDDPDYVPPVDIVTKEIELFDSSILTDWFEYFFADTATKSDILVDGLPGFSGGLLEIEITGAPTCAVGEIAAGKLETIGQTAWGGRINALDFSRVDEDVFGNVTILRRGSAKRIEYPVMWPSLDTRRIDRILDNIRSTPAVFAATPCENGADYGFFAYGFYQTYDINVAGPALSYATIEVRTLA